MERVFPAVLGCAALLAAVWLAAPHHAFEGLASYLPLHTALETVSIVIAALVFAAVWSAYARERPGHLVILACGSLAVACIDFAHALSYPGMPDFVTPAAAEKSIFFWMAGRLVSAATLVAVAIHPHTPLRDPAHRHLLLAASLAATVAICWIGVYRLDDLPDLFIEGHGLTPVKIAGEYVLIALFAAAAVLLYRDRRRAGGQSALLAGAAAISALSELSFTLYSTVTDVFTLLGHVYKVIAYLIIYRAVFVASVREPFERLAEREGALRESEDRYRSLVETMGEGVVMLDASGRCLACNAAAARIIELPVEQIVGRSSHELGVEMIREDGAPYGFEDTPPMRAMQAAEAQTGRILGLRRSDGRITWTSGGSRPLFRQGESRPYAAVTTFHDITERRKAEAARHEREAGLRHAQEMAALAHVVVRPDGSYERWSDNWPRLMGLDVASAPRSTRESLDLVHPEDRERFRSAAIDAARERSRTVLDYRFRCGDGALVHVHQTMEPLMTADAAAGPYWFVTMQDVTEQKQTEERIRRLTRVHAVLSGINAAIVRIRDRTELLQEACRIAVEGGGFIMAWAGVVDRAAGLVRPIGLYGDDVRGFLDVAPLAILETGPAGQGLAGRAVREALPVISNDVAADPQRLMKKECAERGVNSLAVLPLVVGTEVAGVLALYSAERSFFDEEELRLLKELAGDVAFALDHIEKEERVRYLAYYDSLTGLANRTLFLERLAQQLGAAAREHRRLAVVIINIERFKTINDTLGRPAGDALLREFGARMQRAARDPALVARVGADQFAALIVDVTGEDNLIYRLERGDAEVKRTPFALDGQQLRIATRAGVAVYPQDGTDAEALFRNAEAALKQAHTGELYVFYKKEMTARIAGKLALENQLRQALERREFVLHYQPKLELAARRIVGVEALIRWKSPDRGLVPPGEFIPLLEETGLILPVGAWAMAQAVAEHRHWQSRGLPPLRVAVNVSAIQLRSRDFVATVREALREGAAVPGIDLEITESLIMEDVAENIEKLKAVRALGVNIAIDDFGTGYSSLGYLAKLPVQSLKIDRSFTAAMASDPDATTLVSTIVSLGHALRLRVIAEGVESEDQAKTLRLLRCDEAQGYLYSRPLPAAELEALLLAR